VSVGVLLVTHENLGETMLGIVTRVLGSCPLEIKSLPVFYGDDPAGLSSHAQQMMEGLDHGDGVLVMTDMYGATPSNVVTTLLTRKNVRAIAGLNLPMLVRVLNYPSLCLDELVIKAVDGGCNGVMALDCKTSF